MTGVRDLLPGEYAVLGLLSERPLHGYELARLYKAEGLHDACPVEQSLLYAYLRNLEDRGFVEATEERVGRRPPRRQFRLTAEGGQAFERWLQAPVNRMRDVRLDFLIKLYFLQRFDPPAAVELIQKQIAACDAYLERWQPAPDATPFRKLVAQSKQSAARATREWLAAYERELTEAAST